MSEHYHNFSYRARYYMEGDLSDTTTHIIFALHGYGQLAKYFIRKFSGLENVVTIAPEGLSRFYLKDFDGRIGATWMTREDRLTDIENYNNYLNSLYKELEKQFPPKAKITLLGFSQGAATVSRWIATGLPRFDQLILWAGIFPHDLQFDIAAEILDGKKVDYVYGVRDHFITKQKLQEMTELSEKLNLKPEVTTFDGEHTVDSETLKQVLI